MRRFSSILVLLPFLNFIFVCCSDHQESVLHVSLQDVKDYLRPEYRLKGSRIRSEIAEQMKAEDGEMYADAFTHSYYYGHGRFLWITRHGVGSNADTLLTFLQDAWCHGVSPKAFRTDEIVRDLDALRKRELKGKDVNTLAGRLEYRLTKAYLRYSAGLRYGFIKPHRLLNHLLPDDNPKQPYRILFDIDCETANDSFYHHALSQIPEKGALSDFLREVAPTDSLYAQLQADYLAARQKSDTLRARLTRINMERARWRYPRPHGKYVWVNLAGFELTAVDEEKDTSFTMRVCGGNRTHKTPLLQSAIQRVETDPYWIIPMTIIRKEIIPRHTGDTAYFQRNHYRVLDKESGTEVPPESLTARQLTSGRYTVRQDNGAANSLGRLIFRFPNNFAVFLHDTNNHSAFRREVRSVSHGCVRLERPLDLAFFLMEKPDSILEDKLRMAIDKRPVTQWGRKQLAENPNAKKMGYYQYPKPVPVFIDYYTLFPDREGNLISHPDVYHYDEEIEKVFDGL